MRENPENKFSKKFNYYEFSKIDTIFLIFFAERKKIKITWLKFF